MPGSSCASLLYALVLGTGHILGAGAPVADAPVPPVSATASPAVPAPLPDSRPASSDEGRTSHTLGAPIAIERLGVMSGGDSTVDNDVTITGTVDGNSAEGIVSGSNAIGGGAFDNASGINTVIQNTGSNVLIQNGMVVNVQFVPPAP